jgi:hypothetical protein
MHPLPRTRRDDLVVVTMPVAEAEIVVPVVHLVATIASGPNLIKKSLASAA